MIQRKGLVTPPTVAPATHPTSLTMAQMLRHVREARRKDEEARRSMIERAEVTALCSSYPRSQRYVTVPVPDTRATSQRTRGPKRASRKRAARDHDGVVGVAGGHDAPPLKGDSPMLMSSSNGGDEGTPQKAEVEDAGRRHLQESVQRTVEWCRTAPAAAVASWLYTVDGADSGVDASGRIGVRLPTPSFGATLVKAAIAGRMQQVVEPTRDPQVGAAVEERQLALRGLLHAEESAHAVNTMLRLRQRKRVTDEIAATLPAEPPPMLWTPRPPSAAAKAAAVTSTAFTPQAMREFKRLVPETAVEFAKGQRYRTPFVRRTSAHGNAARSAAHDFDYMYE